MGNCQNFKSNDDPIHPSYQNKGQVPLQLVAKAFTWNRDSHGLFDYENKNIFKNVFKLFETSFLIREKNEVKLIKNNAIEDYVGSAEKSCLTQILMKDNNYYITSDLIDCVKQEVELDGLNSNSIWIVVKSLKVNKDNRIYKLSVGDYIKLGRIRFKIKEFGIHNSAAKIPKKLEKTNILEEKNEEKINTEKNSPNKSYNKERVSQFLCRICLSDNSEPDNPFVTPCKCAGTMQFIHIQCLQSWLKSRLQIKTSNCSISFLWKSFECELCKNIYPNFIEENGVRYDIVEIPKPEGPYLMMEILSRERLQSRGIHILSLANKNFIKLGRGHDCDIRIPDISVSRCHAAIRYDKGNFYIEDNASKFGTLVLLKSPMQIDLTHNNVALQVGRTVLYFTVKKCSKKVFKAIVGKSLMLSKNNSNLTDSSEIEPKKKDEIPSNVDHQMGFFDQNGLDLENNIEIHGENNNNQIEHNPEPENIENEPEPEEEEEREPEREVVSFMRN